MVPLSMCFFLMPFFLPLRAFEDLQVFWRATFDKTSLTLVNNGVNLTTQLVRTSGTATCRRGEIICTLTLEVVNDDVRQAVDVDTCRCYSTFPLFLVLKCANLFYCRNQNTRHGS